MKFRITTDNNGELYLEKGEVEFGEFGKLQVYRRSEFLEGQSEDSIESNGYRSIKKQHPNQHIEGYDTIGEELYVSVNDVLTY